MRGRLVGLTRALTIWRLMHDGGRYTLRQLADRFNVCPRTIRRDLYALEDAGIRLACDEPVGGTESHWWHA
jgi:predicted DNA-binding transcriptional regulator YafY